MKFHIYGQTGFVKLPKTTTVQDLRTLARFNGIIKNYLKMKKIEKTFRSVNAIVSDPAKSVESQ